MKITIKCKGMRIAISGIFPLSYISDGEPLNFASHEKDLGVIVDHQFKFHLYTASVASKVNWILGIINKSFP